MDASTFDFISNAVSLILLIAGALGFVCKAWISEWIKNRFAKAVSKELDNYKHELNKELAEHKNALIRELEHFKANIDIQRAIALKMADARLDALRKLHTAFNEFVIRALLCPSAALQHKAARCQAAIDAWESLKRAQADAQIHLPLELDKDLAHMNTKLGVMMGKTKVVLDSNDPSILALHDETSDITLRLRDLIYQPPPELGAVGSGGKP